MSNLDLIICTVIGSFGGNLIANALIELLKKGEIK